MNDRIYDIPGNEIYKYSDAGALISPLGYKDILPISGKFSIPLYGVLYNLDVNWFSEYCKQNVILTSEYRKEINNLIFVPYGIKSHGIERTTLVMFNKPVMYIKDIRFRLIAAYPNIGVSCSGEIINIKSGKKVKPGNMSTGYKVVNVYCSYTKEYKTLLVYRLVALAWVPNDDFIKNPIVDHRDGVKSNVYYKNLEWVSFKENNIRAIDTGLRKDNFEVKVKDYENNKIFIFSSVRAACLFMSRSPITGIIDFCKKPKLINNRYQIKLVSDKTLWDFDKRSDVIKITIDGVCNVYNKLSEVTLALLPEIVSKDRSIGGANRSRVERLLKEKFPDIIIVFPEPVKTLINNMYQTYNISTDTVTVCKTAKELMSVTGLSKSSVQKGLSLGESHSILGYAFRILSETPWKPISNLTTNTSVSVKLTNNVTKEILNCASYREAGKYLDIDKGTVKRLKSINGNINGFKIT